MAHWLEGIFQFLFKYRPTEFAKGDIAFGAPVSVIALLLIVAAVVVPSILSYGTARGKSTSRDRWVLGALRAASLLVLVTCLFRPILLLSAAVPQRNYVGVLIDDSRSMRIADRDGRARSDFVVRTAGGPDSSLLSALSKKFIVRVFRFSSSADRVTSGADATFNAGETHLGDAIDQARQELESVPLSGLVVLTDGADNSRAPIADQLLSLRARSVPVFAVGLGAERFDRDIEIRRVEAGRSIMKGSSLIADLMIRQRGFGGKSVPLVIEDNGAIVDRQQITLPPDGDVAPVRVNVRMNERGPRTITFRVPAQPGEQVEQNNAQQVLVDVRDRREKILYVEGEPRPEMRFMRAAVKADSNLQIVTLQRTAENKFLRLDVDGPDELAGGFPKSRAELFRYRAIVLGSIEASFFTHDQLSMLADFVNVRGGGLLMLGGRRAFAEGGYAGTPLAEVMPVAISGDAVADSLTFLSDLAVQLTPAGGGHAVTQLEATEALSAARWKKMPAVTSVNRIREVKPGAVTLLSGTVVPGGRAGAPGETVRGYQQPILVYQRYGRGLSVALPVQDSWLWQMHADIPVGDPAFSTFWRQLLRWLTSEVPERMVLTLSADQANPRTPISIRAAVADSMFVARNDARVLAHLTADHGGVSRDLPLDWAIDRDGEYRATFTLDEPGLYTIGVNAATGSGATSTTIGDTAYVRVADLNTEFFDAEMRAPLLQRIARETGGKFYTPETAGTLADDVALSKRGITVVNQMDLWDMPIVFLLLTGLVSAEWGYRKARGLA